MGGGLSPLQETVKHVSPCSGYSLSRPSFENEPGKYWLSAIDGNLPWSIEEQLVPSA